MTKEEAIKFLKENLTSQNMIKHCLASGAVMSALARRLGENEEEWSLAGLLHDADAEKVGPEKQGVAVGDWLKDEITPAMRQAMAAHGAENTGVQPQEKIDWALFSSEKLTGLIVASALVLPSKKLADVAVDSVLRRFKEKSFARGAKRENILECQRLGLTLEEFVAICLPAMQEISSDLGL